MILFYFILFGGGGSFLRNKSEIRPLFEKSNYGIVASTLSFKYSCGVRYMHV